MKWTTDFLQQNVLDISPIPPVRTTYFATRLPQRLLQCQLLSWAAFIILLNWHAIKFEEVGLRKGGPNPGLSTARTRTLDLHRLLGISGIFFECVLHATLPAG
ncbi:hypothetical protein AVEN_182033-1 [Araneus ventricosus]|uniref:Uncharacterized protein n=1 Tax=Araneus ventricosus TaxID=182803 RepID=A0A4Y2LDV2_ARAVE|nr:hypothetical protein AVEN_182033-1 [Araneus ventricosus]